MFALAFLLVEEQVALCGGWLWVMRVVESGPIGVGASFFD